MAMSDQAIVYRGSVKNVRLVRPPRGAVHGQYVFEFTDDYSVFDFGKMPDALRGKGSALAAMSACLFEELGRPSSWKKLARRTDVWDRFGGDVFKRRLLRSPAGRETLSLGMKTHYEGMIDRKGRPRNLEELGEPTNRILVKAVPVLPPASVTVDGRHLWDYNALHPGVPQYLIPLENVFRFGLPAGSSLLDRIRQNPGYAAELGLDRMPAEGDWLSRPVLEFSTKLEPADRYLPLETAFNFCGLEGKQFAELLDRTLLVAIFLFALFQDRGLDLWDGKVEFVKTREGILLADTITPDELRITCRGTQISKEPLRQFYKQQDPEFFGAVKRVKAEGPSAKGIRGRVLKALGRSPQRLHEDFRRTMEEMYRALTHRVTGSDLFAGSVDLEEVLERLRQFENTARSL
ncbi:MAG: phosphoribosylaminoimidazolesuccinocarboxamide synthase [bacterium]